MEREPHDAAYHAHRALSILSSPRAIASPLILSLCLSQGPRETRNGRRCVLFCECECVRLYAFEWRVFLDCERVHFCDLRLRMRALLRLAAANGVRFCDYECVRFYAFGCGRFCDCE